MSSSFARIEPGALTIGAPGDRPYEPPTLTRLGTLAELTLGIGGPTASDALGDESADLGSV